MSKFRSKNGITDPEEFIEIFNHVCKSNYILPKVMPDMLISFVKIKVAKWIASWISKQSDDYTWAQLSKSFIEHYKNPLIKRELEKQFCTITMLANEKAQKYFDCFIYSMEKLEIDETSNEALYYYKQELNTNLFN